MSDAESIRPPDPSSDDAAPAPLSVDQLTQAFAQLMGKTGSDAATESQPTESEPPLTAEDGDPAPTPAAVVEAILFVGHPQNEPLSSRLIAGYLRGISPGEVDDLIEQLNDGYRKQLTPYQIVSEGAGYRMALRPEFNRLRDRFFGRVKLARLSQAAIDLLAIVAYQQPIPRSAIDRLRGKPCGAVLNQLVRRELLRVERTSEKPARTLYWTTDRFLDLFGLDSLDDLPRHEDFLRD
jgi:segregation and condensation protein B